jgi:hypothetical protein
MAPQDGQEEPLKKMGKIVNSFFKSPDAVPFLEPVDWRGLELYDYPEVVKQPMDLGKIKRKLERKQYDTAAECASDIRLVWANCMVSDAGPRFASPALPFLTMPYRNTMLRIRTFIYWPSL